VILDNGRNRYLLLAMHRTAGLEWLVFFLGLSSAVPSPPLAFAVRTVFLSASPADPTNTRKEPTMLVLSRHRDESIMIGDDIIVTIVDIRGDKVRLGINAPQDIPVHRQEVYEAIQRENRKASQIRPSETRDLGK
jgi:carbon storage regulator